jgi:hypothetical protein
MKCEDQLLADAALCWQAGRATQQYCEAWFCVNGVFTLLPSHV